MTMHSLRRILGAGACAIALQASGHLAHAQSAATTDATSDNTAQSANSETAEIDRLIQEPPAEDVATRAISKALDASSDEVRWRAARAAGHLRLSSPDIVAKLRRGAADDNWIVQLHCVSALAQSRDDSEATVEALTDAALSENQRVAVAALNGLRMLQLPPEKLADALNQVLARVDGAAAIYAVQAVVDAGAKATPLLKACLKEPNAAYWACQAIEKIGPDAAGAVPELVEYMKSHDQPIELHEPLLALAAVGPAAKSAETEVKAVMERWSDSQSTQLGGLYALGAIGAEDSDQLLQSRAKSDDPFVAMVASWALAKTNPGDDQLRTTAVQRLVAGLTNENPNMGRAAAHGLTSLQLPAGTAAPYLLKAAQDPVAREHIVTALASLGEEVIPHASRALANPETRELAVEVLNRLGAQAAGATDALIEALDAAQPAVKVQINNVLASIGPQAAAAQEALVAELDSSDARVRQSAMYALREIGPADGGASDALLNHMKQSDAGSMQGRFEQLAAAWTLARIASDDQTVVDAVLPLVRDGLASNAELARIESVAAVADLGDAGKSLHSTLAEMAKSDPSAAVRDAAAAALARVQ